MENLRALEQELTILQDKIKKCKERMNMAATRLQRAYRRLAFRTRFGIKEMTINCDGRQWTGRWCCATRPNEVLCALYRDTRMRWYHIYWKEPTRNKDKWTWHLELSAFEYDSALPVVAHNIGRLSKGSAIAYGDMVT